MPVMIYNVGFMVTEQNYSKSIAPVQGLVYPHSHSNTERAKHCRLPLPFDGSVKSSRLGFGQVFCSNSIEFPGSHFPKVKA